MLSSKVIIDATFVCCMNRATGHSVETWEDLMLATKSHTHTGNTDPSSLAAPSTTMEPQQKLARLEENA